MKSTQTKDRRNADLAMIHMAAGRLFGDDRAAYEDWLERHTGKRSAGKLTTDERIALIKMLRREGLIADRGRGGKGTDRPTSAQWAKIGGLARARGWGGLEDQALKSFVKRTARIDDTRWLTRVQASHVITALEKWITSEKERE